MNEHMPGGRLAEDLVGNLARVSEIARRRCLDCADYHITGVANRAARGYAAIDGDRQEIVDLVATTLAARPPGPIHVLIAGSLDTGLLSTVATGAFAAGPAVAARARFTVIDRCGTPLELCEGYGRAAGLAVETEIRNVLDGGHGYAADLICVHSLFRFFPKARHVEVMRRLSSWLNPGGAIAFSQSIASPARKAKYREHTDRKARARDAVLAGELTVSEPVEDFIARLDRYDRVVVREGDYETVADLRAMFAEAHVRELSALEVRHPETGEARRLLSLLAPA